MRIGISLGSNLGDRHEMVRQAILHIKNLCKGQMVESSFYETSPVDCPLGSDHFINAVVVIEWQKELKTLLKKLQQYEVQMGRPMKRNIKNAPRYIDIDVLFAGDLIFKDAELEVPHPRMTERMFVLEPLAEIFPNMRLPHTGRTVTEHLNDLRWVVEGQSCQKVN